MVLEAAEGRLCLCRSFGQMVHGVMFGARVPKGGIAQKHV